MPFLAQMHLLPPRTPHTRPPVPVNGSYPESTRKHAGLERIPGGLEPSRPPVPVNDLVAESMHKHARLERKLPDWNCPGRRFQSMICSLNPSKSMRDWNANCRTGTVPATGSSQPFTRNCGLEPLTPFGLYNIIQREVGVCGTGWPVRMSTLALYASPCSIWGAALSAWRPFRPQTKSCVYFFHRGPYCGVLGDVEIVCSTTRTRTTSHRLSGMPFSARCFLAVCNESMIQHAVMWGRRRLAFRCGRSCSYSFCTCCLPPLLGSREFIYRLISL